MFNRTFLLRVEIAKTSPIFIKPNPVVQTEKCLFNQATKTILIAEDIYLYKIMQERGIEEKFAYPKELSAPEKNLVKNIINGTGKLAVIANQLINPTAYVMILANEMLYTLAFPFHLEYDEELSPVVSLRDVSNFFAAYKSRYPEFAFRRYMEKPFISVLLLSLMKELADQEGFFADDKDLVRWFIPHPEHKKMVEDAFNEDNEFEDFDI